MKPTIAKHCKECKQYHAAPLMEDPIILCPNCHTQWGEVVNRQDVFDFCPICDCRQFYVTKDFNQFLGCFIMFIGIVLVPFTFGLSLPVFALVDWFIYRRVPMVVCCYRCDGEFRNVATDRKFKPYMHHIGLKHDKYR